MKQKRENCLRDILETEDPVVFQKMARGRSIGLQSSGWAAGGFLGAREQADLSLNLDLRCLVPRPGRWVTAMCRTLGKEKAISQVGFCIWQLK